MASQGVQNSPFSWPPFRMQCVRKSYTILAGDVTNGFAVIPVQFPRSFSDANYTLTVSLAQITGAVALDAYSYTVNHQLTAAGFVAEIAVNTATGVAGNVVTIHAIACQDFE